MGQTYSELWDHNYKKYKTLENQYNERVRYLTKFGGFNKVFYSRYNEGEFLYIKNKEKDEELYKILEKLVLLQENLNKGLEKHTEKCFKLNNEIKMFEDLNKLLAVFYTENKLKLSPETQIIGNNLDKDHDKKKEDYEKNCVPFSDKIGEYIKYYVNYHKIKKIYDYFDLQKNARQNKDRVRRNFGKSRPRKQRSLKARKPRKHRSRRSRKARKPRKHRSTKRRYSQ